MGFIKNVITGDGGTKPVDVRLEDYQDPNLKKNQGIVSRRANRLGRSTGFNPKAANGFRLGQASLIDALEGRVDGTAPSVAELQMQRGAEANLQSNIAAAASARGANAGLVQRNLAQNLAGTGQQLVADTGLLRAQEQQVAENTLAQTLSGARGQDITVAATDAQDLMQREQLIQQYIQTGFSLDQAQFQATQAMAAAKTGAAMSAQQNSGKVLGGVLSGGAGVLSTYLSGK